jgi:hypothetical protein
VNELVAHLLDRVGLEEGARVRILYRVCAALHDDTTRHDTRTTAHTHDTHDTHTHDTHDTHDTHTHDTHDTRHGLP